MYQLRDASKYFLWYSLALDESTDVQDTAQLLVPIWGINTHFELTEQLLGVEPLKDTTIGHDSFNVVKNCVGVNQIVRVITNGARYLIGKKT